MDLCIPTPALTCHISSHYSLTQPNCFVLPMKQLNMSAVKVKPVRSVNKNPEPQPPRVRNLVVRDPSRSRSARPGYQGKSSEKLRAKPSKLNSPSHNKSVRFLVSNFHDLDLVLSWTPDLVRSYVCVLYRHVSFYIKNSILTVNLSGIIKEPWQSFGADSISCCLYSSKI